MKECALVAVPFLGFIALWMGVLINGAALSYIALGDYSRRPWLGHLATLAGALGLVGGVIAWRLL